MEQRSERSRIVDAVTTTDGVLVVVGDADARAVAAGAAASSAADVIDVRPERSAATWSGLSCLVDALHAHAGVRIPPALDAARSGAVVGDHLGLGADLRPLIAGAAEGGPVTLLVHDAHLLDLTSAGALAHALAAVPSTVRAVITQDASDRGLWGLPQLDSGTGAPSATPPADPIDGAPAGPLDAAWAAELAGDWCAAARWWLEGGRPDRCASALAATDATPAALEVEARLLFATSSARRWRPAIDRAVAALTRHEPLAAARLFLLDAAARLNRGDAASARCGIEACARLLDVAADDRDLRPVADLHALVHAAAEVEGGAEPAALLELLERPLARLGGRVDGDAVRLLASAVMPLTWAGDLVEARAVLDRLVGVLDGRRRFLLLPHPLATSAWLARRRSRLEVALTDGTRAIELGRASGAANDVRFATSEVAHVEALQGRVEACRAHVAELVPGGLATGAAQVGAVSALAVAELLADRPAEAVALLEPVHAVVGGSRSPAHTAWRHNLAEGYVRTGRTERAAAIVDELEAWAARSGSPREHGQVAWCRGMLAPPGRHDEHFDRARTLLEPYPALRWRCELARLRRLLEDRRRDEAIAVAERLVAEAAAAGVPAGADQVRRLQAEHGLHTTTTPAGPAALSVDDLRVALALVEGADDDEIAGRLHLTARGVDAARVRVLAALGVEVSDDLVHLLPPERSEPGPAASEVRVLGPAAVVRDEHQAVPPPGRPATVLGLVAVERSVTIDRVLDVLWPDDDPARSRPRLRNVLARLRAAVGPVVRRDGELLVLDPAVTVDAHRFESLAERVLAAPPADVEVWAERALVAWTGTPLPSWPYEDWAEEARRRLVGRCVAVLVRRAETRAATGAPDGALDDLEQALALDPDAFEVWQRAIEVADVHGRTGRARGLRRRATERDVELR